MNASTSLVRAWVASASMLLAHCGQSVRPEIPGPRLRWPLSTTRVATSRPTLRWIEEEPVIRAYDVHLCRDRSMRRDCRVQHAAAQQTELTVAEPLAKGRWFWTVTTRDEEIHGHNTVWQFTARPSTVEQNRSWSSRPDFDNDGFDDVPLLALDAAGGQAILAFGAESLTALRHRVIAPPPGWRFAAFDSSSSPRRGIHDVDGDGKTDLVFALDRPNPARETDPRAPRFLRAFYVLHSRSGFEPAGASFFELGIDESEWVTLAPVGDLDGDGFGDVVVFDSWRGDRLKACFGSHRGLDPRQCTAVSLSRHAYPASVVTIGDADGDGADEFVFRTYVGTTQRAQVRHGRRSTLDIEQVAGEAIDTLVGHERDVMDVSGRGEPELLACADSGHRGDGTLVLAPLVAGARASARGAAAVIAVPFRHGSRDRTRGPGDLHRALWTRDKQRARGVSTGRRRPAALDRRRRGHLRRHRRRRSR